MNTMEFLDQLEGDVYIKHYPDVQVFMVWNKSQTVNIWNYDIDGHFNNTDVFTIDEGSSIDRVVKFMDEYINEELGE